MTTMYCSACGRERPVNTTAGFTPCVCGATVFQSWKHGPWPFSPGAGGSGSPKPS